jgi:hypothetical protein
MQTDNFKEIQKQIHELRNFLAPLDLKLDNLDNQISIGRMSFETKAMELETKLIATSSRVAENTVRIDEVSEKVAFHSERINRIESLLKMSAAMAKPGETSVHEDKLNPEVLPPQKPAP